MTRYMPLKRGTFTIGSPFGARSGGFHAGQDFPAADGTPFYAVADGTVLYIGPAAGYGQWIVIDHPAEVGGGTSEYGHMWNAFATGLKVGSRVKGGQLIGYVGSNGQSSGPHLHLSIMPYDYQPAKKIDPMPWLTGAAEPGTPPAPKTQGAAMDYGITKTKHGYNPTSIGIGNSDGPRQRTDWVAVHTQEGGNGDAVGLANFCNANQVSYNLAIDDVDTVEIVPLNEAPWAAMGANGVAFHFCFAGSYAAWSRGRWLSPDASDGLNEDAMLWRGARAVAAACKQFGVPVVKVSGNGWPSSRGICGHGDFGQRGGGHTDPGPGFPWDEFIRRVKTYNAPAAAPPNLIDREAQAEAAWIGARVTKGELSLKDGAWAQFANGGIYWRRGANAAYAVPTPVMTAWGQYRWENGPLGYPVMDCTKVTGGWVQSFQGGVLMVRDGSRGWYVHGEIGKRYQALGWENSQLGWPVSDEIKKTDGTIDQHFEHGTLSWHPTGVVMTLSK